MKARNCTKSQFILTNILKQHHGQFYLSSPNNSQINWTVSFRKTFKYKEKKKKDTKMILEINDKEQEC